MTCNAAKKVVKKWLEDNFPSRDFSLRARTIPFMDLARDKRIFVCISGWQPDPRADDIKLIAARHGFSVEFAYQMGLDIRAR